MACPPTLAGSLTPRQLKPRVSGLIGELGGEDSELKTPHDAHPTPNATPTNASPPLQPLLQVFGVEADVVPEPVVGYAALAGLCQQPGVGDAEHGGCADMGK